VLLGEPQVADRHGDGLLRLDDRVRVVAHELVEHLLRVLRAVQEGVDVGPRQLGDAAQDALLLGHGVPLVVGAARLFQTTVAGATAGSEAPAPAAETAAPSDAASTPAEAAAPAEAAPAPAAVPAPAAEEDAAEDQGADV